MPRIPLDPKHKSESVFDYPRLKLDKGERARIVCIEKDPLYEFVHTLRAPQILNGEPVMEMVKSRDGGETERNKFDFIGRHICLGDIGILQERGVDPVNCPECKVSTESDAVRAPERRFAMHIVRYATQPGGFTVASPFSVTLIAWAYSDTIYNKLADTAAEHGDLTRRDLLLGPCQVAQYQKFDIAIASSAASSRPEATQLTMQLRYRTSGIAQLGTDQATSLGG